eukprot:scpid109634/ scgid19994/ 
MKNRLFSHQEYITPIYTTPVFAQRACYDNEEYMETEFQLPGHSQGHEYQSCLKVISLLCVYEGSAVLNAFITIPVAVATFFRPGVLLFSYMQAILQWMSHF